MRGDTALFGKDVEPKRDKADGRAAKASDLGAVVAAPKPDRTFD
jgi:hypothetical protein